VACHVRSLAILFPLAPSHRTRRRFHPPSRAAANSGHKNNVIMGKYYLTTEETPLLSSAIRPLLEARAKRSACAALRGRRAARGPQATGLARPAIRHSRESANPKATSRPPWMPAFVGPAVVEPNWRPKPPGANRIRAYFRSCRATTCGEPRSRQGSRKRSGSCR
jgi:hypothetical protein